MMQRLITNLWRRIETKANWQRLSRKWPCSRSSRSQTLKAFDPALTRCCLVRQRTRRTQIDEDAFREKEGVGAECVVSGSQPYVGFRCQSAGGRRRARGGGLA